MPTEKISGTQAVLLLFMVRAFNTLNYIPSFNDRTDGMSLLLGSLIGTVIELLALIPALLLDRRIHGQNLISAAYAQKRILGIVFAVIYAMIAFFQLTGGIVAFEYFMTNAIYPNSSMIFIILTMCIACFFAARMGLEGLARAGGIIFVFFLISTALIISGTVGSVDLTNLHPALQSPVASAVRAGFASVSRAAEMYLLILLFPKIKGNRVKCSIGLVLMTLVFNAVTAFLAITVLGEFGNTQTYPYYTLASISDLSIFQRLDALHMTIWVFVAFLRITLFILIANYCLQMVLPQRSHKYCMPALFVISAATALIVGYSPNLLRDLNSTSSVIVLTLTTGLPLVMLLFVKRKKKEDSHEKDAIVISPDNT